MNCRSCGAPLDIAPFQEVACCQHCDTYNKLSDHEHGADRIAWSQQPTETACPRCDEPLIQAFLDGHSAQACRQCHGIMLTNVAFASIVRLRRAEYRGADRSPNPLDMEQLGEPLQCPECQWTMEVHPYYGPGNQIIDSCVRCGLVWINSGELTLIEQAPGRR